MVSSDISGTGKGQYSVVTVLGQHFPPSFYFLQRVFLWRSVRACVRRPTIAMITFILVGLSFSFNDAPWYNFLSYYRRSKVRTIRTIRLGGVTEFVFFAKLSGRFVSPPLPPSPLILDENDFSSGREVPPPPFSSVSRS